MTQLRLIGRSSSHFTRLPRMLAEELGIAHEFVPIYDMTALDASNYADNPALKLPILRSSAGVLFGAQNICRALAESAGRSRDVVWPEDLQDHLSRNAQELVWHCMGAQVQLVFGLAVAKLPEDNVYFAKARTGLRNALEWLDRHLHEALDALPPSRRLSLFELSLFCTVEHVQFRSTVAMDPYSALRRFALEYAERSSAQRTVYRLDLPPG